MGKKFHPCSSELYSVRKQIPNDTVHKHAHRLTVATGNWEGHLHSWGASRSAGPYPNSSLNCLIEAFSLIEVTSLTVLYSRWISTANLKLRDFKSWELELTVPHLHNSIAHWKRCELPLNTGLMVPRSPWLQNEWSTSEMKIKGVEFQTFRFGPDSGSYNVCYAHSQNVLCAHLSHASLWPYMSAAGKPWELFLQARTID